MRILVVATVPAAPRRHRDLRRHAPRGLRRDGDEVLVLTREPNPERAEYRRAGKSAATAYRWLDQQHVPRTPHLKTAYDNPRAAGAIGRTRSIDEFGPTWRMSTT